MKKSTKLIIMAVSVISILSIGSIAFAANQDSAKADLQTNCPVQSGNGGCGMQGNDGAGQGGPACH